MKKNLYILLLASLMLGCSGSYKGVPRAKVLDYQTAPTYGSVYALAHAYGEELNAAVKADTLHPGMYAEYGVTLALMGYKTDACRMLNAEMRAFPESRQMVERIKQRLLPDMMADTMVQMPLHADMAMLESHAYDSLTALKPFTGIASVIDSSDRERVMMQTPVDSVEYPVRLTATQKRLMLAEEQQRQEKLRQAEADSIAAAKQAKIDARKQAKIDKKNAKKQKEKEKKAAAKAKENARKEQQKQREEERKRKAAERKAQQEAKKK